MHASQHALGENKNHFICNITLTQFVSIMVAVSIAVKYKSQQRDLASCKTCCCRPLIDASSNSSVLSVSVHSNSIFLLLYEGNYIKRH